MSNYRTIMFMVILSFICALILSVLASVLAKPKEIAKELDRSKQMMIAAKILNHEGNFLLPDSDGKSVLAKYSPDGLLVPGSVPQIATQQQLLEVFKRRLRPFLVDKEGKLNTFEAAKIVEDQYVNTYKKSGYYKEPLMLIYKIMPNLAAEGNVEKEASEDLAEGYVIPVNGFGLWDAIYGYLAIKPDGDSVIGITWYDQKETPGLGANIADPPWQNLFPGKKIFQAGASGQTDFKTAPLGIVVVKGKVAEVLGDAPKARSAVDGMAGATLTGNGVTDAYRDVLAPYRSFLMKLQAESGKQKVNDKPSEIQKKGD
ncbi:MAG: NADH:ubiquinone reductase (Na(+)-transporting) subunit C [Parachlamydiaceae bacterium]|nr:NADH:ubiquinone reductase (Na(+)-transporting) subunit C [Parachlamydiaceae bacterium]